MMNDPFFRKQQPWSFSRSVPVQQAQQKSSPKVVSVPVHFVSSNQPPTTISKLKDSAVLNIQKLFRGFLVRKSVKKIASIRNEVYDIERRIDDTEVVSLIRRDAKERLRVNETLMSLLFKLDSIRGVDCGIRDLRKAVTKKAIGLQEKVDSIDHQTLDSNSPGEIDSPDNVRTSTLDQATEAASNSVDDRVENHEAIGDDKDVKEVVENCNPGEDVIGEVEAMETSPVVNMTHFGGKDDDAAEKHNCADYSEGNRVILEDLRGDNEKIMKMMSQISERNEMQMRMINSLSRRVEQLEKAEKQRMKKKTHASLRRKRDVDSLCI
ncbi:putative IQ motif, EF-hand binding, BAG domain, BAG domain superfamily [Helianthus annuus]|uniref:IQ motif, EF-hand binding, BAG domain, BAG domain superfamily n=1 Tax=Helianthus annuus TaxID=4232 RepID=A0A251SJE0_HELAN|nr:BAG family molecular chaperone regulator 6 [Helianthus annuus]KAF5770031.1 putative IQ motif, EF-hand binding, BAG domain, BAG domain superfamily [Helianthus annuus]KAJ0464982.1 putative IQ motif, EF-hand binding, BAG domain, BAG domain superfamily [Helianthus annuus]KAJ0486575.1 putative IQ motif, EF-hand binding, BAG domain, BAG domain superfamily [Helianthus annuus]KAJ0657141.1 putative IQ motif, EF-hand binding, BAG domain, BAG domain superfamily [Helianthus annuus]KAJ0660718.1 putative